jgi:hypothetical protein
VCEIEQVISDTKRSPRVKIVPMKKGDLDGELLDFLGGDSMSFDVYAAGGRQEKGDTESSHGSIRSTSVHDGGSSGVGAAPMSVGAAASENDSTAPSRASRSSKGKPPLVTREPKPVHKRAQTVEFGTSVMLSAENLKAFNEATDPEVVGFSDLYKKSGSFTGSYRSSRTSRSLREAAQKRNMERIFTQMQGGQIVGKHCRKSRPHSVKLFISEDMKSIGWHFMNAAGKESRFRKGMLKHAIFVLFLPRPMYFDCVHVLTK